MAWAGKRLALAPQGEDNRPGPVVSRSTESAVSQWVNIILSSKLVPGVLSECPTFELPGEAVEDKALPGVPHFARALRER